MAKEPNITNGRAWADAELNRMVQLWSQGYSANQISKLLPNGRSRNAVIGKLFRMGISKELRKAPANPGQSAHTPKVPKLKVKKPNVAKPIVTVPGFKPLALRPSPMPTELTKVDLLEYPNAKHWMERAFGECAYPIVPNSADTISCCDSVKGDRQYCATHLKHMFNPIPKNMIHIRIPRGS